MSRNEGRGQQAWIEDESIGDGNGRNTALNGPFHGTEEMKTDRRKRLYARRPTLRCPSGGEKASASAEQCGQLGECPSLKGKVTISLPPGRMPGLWVQWMFPSHTAVSLPLFPPPFSLSKNKQNLK